MFSSKVNPRKYQAHFEGQHTGKWLTAVNVIGPGKKIVTNVINTDRTKGLQTQNMEEQPTHQVERMACLSSLPTTQKKKKSCALK